MERGEPGSFPSGNRDQDLPRAPLPLSPALDAVMPLIYAELRRIAGVYMRKERSDHTLQPTALVHEAWLRLSNQRQVDWGNQSQVIGVAAHMMRRILADYANRRDAGKRLGKLSRAPLEDVASALAAAADPGVEFLDLDRALTELEALDAQMASIVELRYFGGLTIAETAEVSGLSTATVTREWAAARLWLLRRICEAPAG